MRCEILFAALVALSPLVGQQAAPNAEAAGKVDERVLQNAVRDALLRSAKAPRIPFGPNRVVLKPLDLAAAATISGETVCAVPLLAVPVAKGTDNGILLKDGAASADNKMIVPPAVPACAVSRGR